MTNKCIIVLGMHRSATSLVARSLNNEVFMGEDLYMESPDNPKGHYEDKEFLEINRRILSDAGGDWRNLPSEERILEVGKKYQGKIRELLKKRMELDYESFGWKDPRTTVTIKVYMPILKELGIEVFIISCFRNSKEVAKSLFQRNNMSIAEGLSLTEQYNKRLIKFLSEEKL